MLGLGDLARFVAVAQAASLGQAAEALGIAASSLSARLKVLEDALGFRLFERTGRGLVHNDAAGWLFRESLNILHAESVARRVMGGAPLVRQVVVEIEIGFTIGRLTQAVAHATEAAAALHPGAVFRVQWREGRPQARPSDGTGRPRPCAVRLRHAGPTAAAAWEPVGPDPLLLVPARRGCGAAQPGLILVPRIPGVPSRWLKERLRALAPEREAVFTEDHPSAIPAILAARPKVDVLVPGSALSSGPSTRLLDPTLTVSIVASTQGGDPAGTAFVHCLRQALAAPDMAFAPAPKLTTRQLHCFDFLRQAVSVSGAARLAGVTQASVTKQLGLLERTLAHPLFTRGGRGLALTEAGHRFEQAAALLNAARHQVMVKRPAVAGRGGGRLDLGILPAVGPDGFLISGVARAVEAWRQRHPGLSLRVLEQPNVTLQERIRRGTLDLGIISIRSRQMARFDLGSSEALAFVANPRSALAPRGQALDFEALARLPLVLPTAQFGLRQLIDDAGRARGIKLHPVIEVDSLSMCLALVRESRLGTILPPSDVGRLVEAGELTLHPIQRPRVVRTLQIIYSTDRALSEPERDLVRLLRAQLAAKVEVIT